METHGIISRSVVRQSYHLRPSPTEDIHLALLQSGGLLLLQDGRQIHVRCEHVSQFLGALQELCVGRRITE